MAAIITFPGDDDTLRYAKDAGIFVPGIDSEVESTRQRFTREEVLASEPTVIFCFGQSNAANHGLGRYRPKNRVFCFNPLDCAFYLAEDPIPGATGDDGSPWSRLGDLLIDSGYANSLLLVSIAVGGTVIAGWVGGDAGQGLVFSIRRATRP